MPTQPAQSAQTAPAASREREARLRRACAELDARLRASAGREGRAEEWLDRDADLAGAEDATVELIYTEFAVREEITGRRPDAAEFFARFPGLRDALERQFGVHELLAGEAPAAESSPASRAGPPEVVGPYRLMEPIGRGAAATVWRARHALHGRVAAVKLLDRPAGRADDAEVRAAARLEHPNIVRLYETGRTADGRPWLATELVEGGRLADRLAAGPLDPSDAAGIAEALARAVAFAHAAGVVHCDLSPANVLMADGGRTPKVADFGLSRLSGSAEPDRPPAPVGTPGYMAPELAAGSAPPGTATDVWSLGALLHAMLTGRPPFRGETPLETLAATVSAEPEPPQRLRPGLPADLVAVCVKCLSRDPAGRYASASELAEDLARFRSGRPVSARPAGRLRRAVMWARRQPAAAGLVASVILGAAAMAVGGMWTNARLREAADESDRRRRDAESAERTVRTQWESARRDAFALALLQADAIRGTDPGRAAGLLDDEDRCPADLRDFSWGLLRAMCRRERLMLAEGLPQVQAVGFSADGRSVAARCRDGSLSAWDAATGRPVEPLDGSRPAAMPLKGRSTLRAGRSAPDDHGRTPLLRLHDASGAEVAAVRPHLHGVSAVAVSADRTRLATGGRDRVVRLWRIAGESLEAAGEWRGHLGPVTALAISPSGSALVSASEDGTVRLWDTAPHDAAADRLTGGAARINGLAWTPDGRLAAACEDGVLRVWSPAAPDRPAERRFTAAGLIVVAVSRDGRRLAVGDRGGGVWLGDADGGEPTRVAAAALPVRGLALSPDGALLAAPVARGNVGLWRLSDGPPGRAAAGPVAVLPGRHGPTSGIGFSPDGAGLAVAADDGTVTLWDVATRSERCVLAGGARTGLVAVFSPDGNSVAGGGLDYAVRLWDAADGRPRALLMGHTEFVFSAAFSPDGRTLATGSGNRFADDIPGEVRLWDAVTGRPRLTLPDTAGPVAFSPDGRILATVVDGSAVRLWRSGGPPSSAAGAGRK